MKRLLLVLLFTLSTNNFAANIYCPQTITCTEEGCYPIPENFHISYSNGNYTPGATYHFYEAIFMEAMKAPYNCWYAVNVETKKTVLSITSKKPMKADTHLIDNNWFNAQHSNGNPSNVFRCHHNAFHCPFKDY